MIMGGVKWSVSRDNKDRRVLVMLYLCSFTWIYRSVLRSSSGQQYVDNIVIVILGKSQEASILLGRDSVGC